MVGLCEIAANLAFFPVFIKILRFLLRFNMKKFFLCLTVFAAFLFVFTACGGSKNDDKSEKPDSSEAVTDEDSMDTTPSDAEPSDSDSTDSADSAKDPDDASEDSDTDDDGFDPGESNNDNEEPLISTFCKDDGVKGELTTCVDDAVCEVEECPGGSSCKDETECGECRNYEEECRDGDSGWGVYQCRAGKWTFQKACNQTVTCTNGNDGRGLLKTCVGDECETVTCSGSCNRQGTACGESGCIDYTMECRDDMLLDSNGGGAIAQCQFGKWQIMSTCTDGASCNKETGNCGECKNGNTKCENHEISGIMNKSCNYQGECETDSNGNLKYYSATIGVLVLCYDGRWSDYNDLTRSSYCPPVNHTFQIYKNYSLTDWSTAMTKVYRSATTYDDYHYSSCHNSGAVSECGTCHNSFHVCGDEYYSNKLVGHIQNCQNGMLTYGNYCGDKNQLCQDITQCK